MRTTLCTALAILLPVALTPANDAKKKVDPVKKPKIEVCFVLDTTGSMGGLIQGAKDNINVLDMMLQLAQGKTLELTKSVMFLDSTVSIPTIIGVPLKLSVNGTASVSLQANGKVDMRHAPRTIDIDGSIQPRYE